jgi:hypothetical protein
MGLCIQYFDFNDHFKSLNFDVFSKDSLAIRML